MKHVLVFLALVLVDFCWSRYMLANAERRMLPASAWSAAIIVLGAFATVEYVKDPTLIATAAAGAFVGTWLSLRHARA